MNISLLKNKKALVLVVGLIIVIIVLFSILKSSSNKSDTNTNTALKIFTQGDFRVKLPENFKEVESNDFIGARYEAVYDDNPKLNTTISIERYSDNNTSQTISSINSIHQNHAKLADKTIGSNEFLGFKISDSEYYYLLNSTKSVWRLQIVSTEGALSGKIKGQILESFKVEDPINYEE